MQQQIDVSLPLSLSLPPSQSLKSMNKKYLKKQQQDQIHSSKMSKRIMGAVRNYDCCRGEFMFKGIKVQNHGLSEMPLSPSLEPVSNCYLIQQEGPAMCD